MSVFEKALETFENFESSAGVEVDGEATLAPVSHTIQKVDWEVTIDANGCFVDACAIEESDKKTIIPATQESASRTGNNLLPHPLCDKLKYIAPLETDAYQAYLSQLKKWDEYEKAVKSKVAQKLDALIKYVEKGSIVGDLLRCGLIKESDSVKKIESDYGKMIRWRIVGVNEESACWKDKDLLDAYTAFYAQQMSDTEKEFCMLTGELTVLANKHPKGVISSAGNAKLISSDDSYNFTYRGRFTEPREAATIGYVASQKAHNALRWVASNSSVTIAKRTFVCWNPKGIELPSIPIMSGLSFEQEEPAKSPADYSKKLFETILGFRNSLPATEGVVIAVFDAATDGRLSLTYYRELMASDFLDRIENWYSTCCWEFGIFGYQSPSLLSIATCAFGNQRGGKDDKGKGGKIELDDKTKKEQVLRLLPCVIAGGHIPVDIAKALAHRASMPLAYTPNERHKVIQTACAVIRKYHNDKKENYSMELEPNKRDRSYQYGRLLAVYEKLERDTYDKDRDGNREPNAIRMQFKFSEQPLRTMRILEDRVNPYRKRLNQGAKVYYSRLIAEIISTLGDGATNARLGDTYILGYYLQKQALYEKKNQSSTNSTEEE